MNWDAVRRTNARRAARKAQQERWTAQESRRIAALGGEITAEEIRGSEIRVEPPAPGRCHERLVLTFRGRDWVLGGHDGDRFTSMAPYRSWAQDYDLRNTVPMTPDAGKVLNGILARRCDLD